MNLKGNRFNHIDKMVTSWMAKNGILLLRVSVGIIFFWVGVLKFFHGVRPAQDLAAKTIEGITLGLVSGKIGVLILAVLEVVIGIGLLSGLFLREIILLLFLQMLGTLTPVFIFPAEVFEVVPWVPTLEGQYIIKNLVLISAGIVIGATVRGGYLVADSTKSTS